jgi:flagellar FliJ protein
VVKEIKNFRFVKYPETNMYRFNLEPLLNHRRYQEEVLQKELADLKKQLAAEKNKLRSLKKKMREYLQHLQQKQKEGHSASEINLFFDFVDHISKETQDQHQKVVGAEQKLFLKREELIAAMKKRKALEKLKAKGWQAYQQKQQKKERDFMDEVAGRQFHFKP